MSLEALLTSTVIVTFAEIGDKTQLLAMLLATRFHRPMPVILGILVATIANHFFAALLGQQAALLIDGQWFRYAIAASFVAMGIWALIPDKLDKTEAKPGRFGAFLTTTIAFFLVEMGDKTQLATVALGARFENLVAVTTGTTLGMMLANVPAVFFGKWLHRKVPFGLMRGIAAALFIATGLVLALRTAGMV